MTSSHKVFMMLCSLLVWLGLGCGDDGSGSATQDNDAGGSATSGVSSQGGGGGTADGAGATAASQEPTPPPEMPRALGPPDGIYCESAFDPPPETCSAGSRCCPNGPGGDHEQVCIADAAPCPTCDTQDCGQLLCDGPEDCSAGQFCCYAKRGFCGNNPEDCTPEYPAFEDSSWISVDCRARCVGDLSDPDHGVVVCQDDRDCPGPYAAGRCQPIGVGQLLPFGIKVCSGP